MKDKKPEVKKQEIKKGPFNPVIRDMMQEAKLEGAHGADIYTPEKTV